MTIAKALKFSRHDFLNELQLILLNIDLGKWPEAKNALLSATDKMQQVSKLEKLRMPATELWISTFDWVHTVFSKTLHCDIIVGKRLADDEKVAQMLEQAVSDITRAVDPFHECMMEIQVNATESEWEIRLNLKGPIIDKRPTEKIEGNFAIHESIDSEQWTFMVSGR